MGTHCGRAGERTQRATLSRPERLKEEFGPCAIISTSECCAELGRRASDGEPAFPRSLKSNPVGSRIARGEPDSHAKRECVTNATAAVASVLREARRICGCQ